MARMGDTRISCRVFVGRHEGKRSFRRLGVGGRLIVKLVVNKWCLVALTELPSLRILTGEVSGTCERGNEPSGSIKCGGFLV